MLNSYEVNCNSHDGIKYHFQLSILSQTLSPALYQNIIISSLDTHTHTFMCILSLRDVEEEDEIKVKSL